MVEARNQQQAIRDTPPSLGALVAALLEPTMAVLSYLSLCWWFNAAFLRPDLILCLLVLALTLPGRNRFNDAPLAVALGQLSSWLGLLAILVLCAYVSSSFGFFDPTVLLWWALVTPVAQWAAVQAGQRVLHLVAARPENRRAAVVIGAGASGVKVANALLGSRARGVDFLGYFDDRTDERVHNEAASQRLGPLKDAALHVREHAIREVYITLPLGSQPRIVELIDQLQGTTASVFFVPDMFAIGIIRGRLQDVNGVPVVSIGEAPLGGVDRVVKRIGDIVRAATNPTRSRR